MRHCILVLLGLCALAQASRAQDALRVLATTPSDSATPGSVVTVIFDRPVAGALGSMPDALSIMRLEPNIPGAIGWRDPNTLRFIATQPLQPGTSVVVTVDTNFTAMDGARLAQPYRFTVRVPGPTPLGHKTGTVLQEPGVLGRRPTLKILYSAPVNLDSVRALARLEFSAPCPTRVVGLRPIVQRNVIASDGFGSIGGPDRDTTADRFRRVVELTSDIDLADSCAGYWYVPAFDPAYPDSSWRYRVRTPGAFVLVRPACHSAGLCEPGSPRVAFSTHVRSADVRRHVRLSPDVPFLVDQDDGYYSPKTRVLKVSTPMVAGTIYGVLVDSAMRDVYGRPLQGPASRIDTLGNFYASVTAPAGVRTLPRSALSLEIGFTNVDTLAVTAVRIPERLRKTLLSITENARNEFLRASLRPALRDTFRIDVATNGVLDIPGRIRVPLPPEVAQDNSGTFYAIRVMAKVASRVSPELASQSPTGRVAYAAVGGGMYSQPLGLLLQVSNVAAHTRLVGDSGAVFISSLEGGGPVPGASLQLYDADHRLMARGTTDAEGLAMLAPTGVQGTQSFVQRDPVHQRTRYLEVESDLGRATFVVEGSLAHPWAFRVSPGYGVRVQNSAAWTTVLTDRDIYRPGEKLFAKLIARRGVLGALSVPASDSVRWSVVGGAGNTRDTVWTGTTFLSRYGTASDSLVLPAGVIPGNYSIEGSVRIGGRWEAISPERFRVSAYRAPEFRVAITSDSAMMRTRDSALVQLRADYLFGAPMAAAQVNWSAQLTVRNHPASSSLHADGYSIGVPSYAEPSAVDQTLRGVTHTNSAGVGDVLIPLDIRSIAGHGTLAVTVAVSDANNLSVTESRSVPLPPPALLVAARAVGTESRWRIGAPQTIEVLVATPEGRPVAGVPARVTISRRRCSADTTAGAFAGSLRCEVDTVAQSSIESRSGPTAITFTPTEVARYDFWITAVDSLGNSARTYLRKFVDTTTIAASPPPPPTTPRFAVSADSARLLPGDTALVQLTSPFALADAWITREREGVLEQKRITVRSGLTVLREPITDRDAPNVWIGVALIRRGQDLRAGDDTFGNDIQLGYVNLLVDTVMKRLSVDVSSASAMYAPGDTATFNIRVQAATGSGEERGVISEVAVWAVDEGVVSLTGHQLVGPLARLYALTGFALRLRTQFSPTSWTTQYRGTALVLSAMVRSTVVDDPTAQPSGHGELRNSALSAVMDALQQQSVATTRRDFRSTAFFIGTVYTDSAGGASVRVKLPDNLSTYRVMAVALTDGDQYGSGQASYVVTRNVVVRPALPRFVRYGDEVRATALLSIRDGSRDQLRVSASVDSAALISEAIVATTVENGATGAAHFHIRIPSATSADVTRVTFSAMGSAGSDAVETAIPIRTDRSPRSHTFVGSVVGSQRVVMMLPRETDAARSTITLAAGASPIAAIRSNYERLRDYPYRSSEKIASAGSALLALQHAERTLGSAGSRIDSTNVLADLQRAADELSRRERYGWIMMWPTTVYHNGSHAWLTAYAGTYLLNARRAGVVVRQSLHDAIDKRMLAVARDSVPILRPDTITGSPAQRRASLRYWLSGRVAAAQYLRHAGVPDSLAEGELVELAGRMSWEDRVVLADMIGARAALDSLWQATSIVGNRVELHDSLRGSGEYVSRIRPAARLLSATLRLSPSHERLGALVQTVMQQGRAERDWAWNTQDYASAAVALSDFAVSQRGSDTSTAARTGITVRSAAGGTLISQTVGRGPSVTSATLEGLLRARGDSMELTLMVSTDSRPASAAGPVYYAITVNEVPLARPVTPDMKGMIVERWFEDFNTGQPISEAVEGSLVRVRMQITVPADRQFVALEDMLPAGLEVVDLTLRTSASLGPFVSDSMLAMPDTSMRGSGPSRQRMLYGSWDSGWWQPWEHKEVHDDRVVYFARQLFSGVYTATYVARATTVGTFVSPPAHAEEMFNRALQGRSAGGLFIVTRRN